MDSVDAGAARSWTIRRAVAIELESAADVLAEAFDDYPWTRWSIPEADYSSRLRELQHLYLSYAQTEGIVLVGGVEGVDGVIALLPPTATPPPELEARVMELLGDRLDVVAQANLPAAPGTSWTLETVGVHPSEQGTGLGTNLIHAGLAAVAAAGGIGVALETSSDSNVRLYERCGFVVAATTRIDGGPTVHSMTLADCRDVLT